MTQNLNFFPIQANSTFSTITQFAQELEESKLLAESLTSLIAKSREEGFTTGYDEGKRLGQLEAINNFASLDRIFKNHLKIVSKKIVDAIAFISSEVIGENIKTNKKALLIRIQKALSQIDSPNKFKLILNQKDIESITEQFSKIKSSIDLTIEENQAIPEGSAIVELETGQINIDTKLHLAHFINSIQKKDDELQTLIAKDLIIYLREFFDAL